MKNISLMILHFLLSILIVQVANAQKSEVKIVSADTALFTKQLTTHRANDLDRVALLYRLSEAYRLSRITNKNAHEAALSYALQALELGISLNTDTAINLGAKPFSNLYFIQRPQSLTRKKLDEIADKSNKISAQKRQVRVYEFIGNAYASLRDSKQATVFLTKALNYFEATGDLNHQMLILKKLADTYDYQGRDGSGNEYLKRAIALAQATGNKRMQALYLIELGHNYEDTNHKEDGMKCYREAEALQEEINDYHNLSETLRWISNYYSDKKKFKETAEILKKSLNFLSEIPDFRQTESNELYRLNGQLGEAYAAMKDYAIAEKYFQEAVNAAKTPKDKVDANSYYYNYYLSRNNYVKAIELEEKILKIANQARLSYSLGYYEDLGRLYSFVGDTAKALALYNQIKNDPDYRADSYMDIGDLYLDHEPAKALSYYQKAYQENEKLAPSDRTMNQQHNINFIGQANLKLGRYSEALRDAKIAIKDTFTRTYFYAADRAAAFRVVAVIYRDGPDSLLKKEGIKLSSRLTDALQYLNNAKTLLESTGETNGESLIQRELYLTYEKLHDYKNAHEAYQQYILLRDSVNNQKSINNFEIRQANNLFEKKSDSIKFKQLHAEDELKQQMLTLSLNKQLLSFANQEKMLQQVRMQKTQADLAANKTQLASSLKQKAFEERLVELQKLQIGTKQKQSYFLFAGIAALLGLCFFIARNYQNQRKANEEIKTQKSAAEHNLYELQHAQQQLVQAEKMASLGELTAGIAHEIQNPLNFVNNFSDVNEELLQELEEEIKAGNLEEALALAGDLRANEQKISHHGKRADSIVKGMLEHSRIGGGHKQSADLNALADEFLKLSYHGLRAKDKTFNAELLTDFDKDLPQISVVQQDLGRVLLNLFNNAFYTVNQKAKIADADYQPAVSVSTQAAKDRVVIRVKDNGSGIPDNIKDKIMQPFFTTKPTGEGTGLGLSLSYDIIVKAHSGKIDVISKLGEGSEFIITLPRT